MAELKIEVEELSPFLRRVSVEPAPGGGRRGPGCSAYVDLSRTVKVKGFPAGQGSAPRAGALLQGRGRARGDRHLGAAELPAGGQRAGPVSGRRAAGRERQARPGPALSLPRAGRGQAQARSQGLHRLATDGEEGRGQRRRAHRRARQAEGVDGHPRAHRGAHHGGLGRLGDGRLRARDRGQAGRHHLERNVDQAVELTDGTIVKGHIPELRGIEVGKTCIEVVFPFPDDYQGSSSCAARPASSP